MIISTRTVVVIALLTLIVAITTISIQTFTNAVSAEPQQRQQLQQDQGQLQLATVATNTTNTNGNEGISLSSPTSSSPSPLPSTRNIRPNIQTDFNPSATYPRISKFAYVDPSALVIGDCEIGKLVLVAPFAVCRGDEGTPIRIGDYSNMQDGVILHALETTSHGKNMDDRRYSAEGSL